MQVDGVGTFCEHPGRWESYPAPLGGSALMVETPEISTEQQNLCRHICANWKEILAQSRAYIEARRTDYGLHAQSFIDPGVFIESGEQWCIFFDTDREDEAVVGVEFKGRQPFQLIIGD